MTTPLLCKAYGINQKINDRVISYPLKYDIRTNKWKFECESQNSKLFRTHLLIYILLGILTCLFGVTLIYMVTLRRDILQTLQVLAGSVIFLTTFNGFVTDSLVVSYGNDIAVCINATFALAKNWPAQKRGNFEISYYNFCF